MVFNTLSQTFSFHSSPDTFISSRIESLAISEPHALPSPSAPNRIILTSLLNRKVHVVSSYRLCKDVMALSSSPDAATLAACRTVSPAESSSSSSISLASFASAFSFGGVKGRRGEGEGGVGSSGSKLLKPDTFVAAPAYDQLMADFFPAPNVLLQDGAAHATNKQAWKGQLADFPADTASRVRGIAEKHVATMFPSGSGGRSKINLYQALKSLSWEILLGIVLDISPSGPSSKGAGAVGEKETAADFAEIEALQETLLRGQFSLFPVSLNSGLWQSPRSKGIQARKELQARLKQIVADKKKQATDKNTQTAATCPLLKAGKVSDDDAASHALLFTSSIAVKALASLLLAMTMNLFLWRDQCGHDNISSDGGTTEGDRSSGKRNEETPDASRSLADFVRSQASSTRRTEILTSILHESERLSPPVIGLMRRVQHDVILHTDPNPDDETTTTTTTTRANKSRNDDDNDDQKKQTGHPVQSGEDIWLYLPLASRDRAVFGPDAAVFRWDRYLTASSSGDQPTGTATATATATAAPAEPLTFGTGPKSCIGTALIRSIILTVADVLVQAGFEMDLESQPEPPDETENNNNNNKNKNKKRDLGRGVKAWLGWMDIAASAGGGAATTEMDDVQKDVARELKQLPVQRPREAVWVGLYDADRDRGRGRRA